MKLVIIMELEIRLILCQLKITCTFVGQIRYSQIAYVAIDLQTGTYDIRSFMVDHCDDKSYLNIAGVRVKLSKCTKEATL
jgi:hypothetical protein